ncbi:hypothetical protein H5410_051638 [Solanum commersonii]|uniref:Uncharacterized protein n=1 Tax=Solanum commersonii TaxID=4109 RepID=A0A9J5WZ00_SOLCO|nr:hypothetical protein H5410_051638 [Solanum commersonii]
MSARWNRSSYISMHISPKYSFLSPQTPKAFSLPPLRLFTLQNVIIGNDRLGMAALQSNNCRFLEASFCKTQNFVPKQSVIALMKIT